MIRESKFTHILSSIVSNSMSIVNHWRSKTPCNLPAGRWVFLEPLLPDVDKSVRKAPKLIKIELKTRFDSFFDAVKRVWAERIHHWSNILRIACFSLVWQALGGFVLSTIRKSGSSFLDSIFLEIERKILTQDSSEKRTFRRGGDQDDAPNDQGQFTF